MIPKKIQYCWFGGKEKPKAAQKCIASWKKFCPDYEIIEWNESNFNIDTNPYTRMCYDSKKFAFLSDYVRLVVVEKFGGIYFDTDVELIKSPDFLLDYDAFFGFETPEFVATGLGFGSVAHGKAITAMLREYDFLTDGKHDTVGCPQLNTKALEPFGLKKNGEKQTVADAVIFPTDWFNPYDAPTGRLEKTENTVSVHWYSASWLSKKLKLRSKLMRPIHRIFGTDAFKRFR